MTLLIISIPFMLVAVGIAVVPLIAMSHTEARHIAEEIEQHRLAHQAHRHHARAMHPNDGIDVHILAGSTESLRARETSLVQGG
jgi:hypothetical protein